MHMQVIEKTFRKFKKNYLVNRSYLALLLKGNRFMFWVLVPNNFIESNLESMEIIWNPLNVE